MRGNTRLIFEAARSTGAPGIGIAIIAIAEPAVRLALPAAVSGTVDAAVQGRGSGMLVFLGVLLAMGTVIDMGLEVFRTRIEARGALSLRQRVFQRLFKLSVAGQREFTKGDLLARTLDSTKVTATGPSVLVTLVTSFVGSVGALVALFWIDLWLGLLFVAGAPMIWLWTSWLIKRIGSVTIEYQRLHAEISTRFVDAIQGARTIRASGTAEREIGRVLDSLPALGEAGRDFWTAQRKATWQVNLFMPILQVGVLLVAGFGVLEGRVSPGELLAAQFYLAGAMGLLRQAQIFAQFARARGAAHRVREVLDIAPQDAGDEPLGPGEGRLTFINVRVSRDEKPVLDGVNLDVPPGRSVAIVGDSGTTKSTLTEVAGGLLTPDSGTVLLDGVPLCDMRRDELRQTVSFAFERPNLLGETVGEALSYSDDPPTRERVRTALRAGAAAYFVERLPKGLDTPLADLRLSGGELQRLGLARAVARDARLVILDDATSSVDTATETEIGNAFDHVLRGTTRLTVAHRMSTAARADVVVWMEDGKVRSVAPHEQLMQDRDYVGLFQPRRAKARDMAKERARDPELTAEISAVNESGDPESTLQMRIPTWPVS